MTNAPSPFSAHNPRLQIAIDASSLKNYQFCPRYYQYVNLEGWFASKVDLEFGGLIASGLERYQKARLAGANKIDAILAAVKWAMEATWIEDPETGVSAQWGGRYEQMWKCEGTEPYRNPKGNRAKCPFSHVRMWVPGEAPTLCGECGSPTRSERRYIPASPNKNRYTLIRSLIWYGLEQPENLEDGYHPYIFPNGQPAVELTLPMPLPWQTPYGEQYVLVVNFDYIAEYDIEHWITDNKTTKFTLDEKFWSTYSPDTQFDTYDLVGSVMLPDLNIKGVMVDGIQILVEGTNYGKHPYRYNEGRREEHLKDLGYWIKDMERSAEEGYWRMNKRSCRQCAFKRVCSQPPSMRENFLASNFTKGPVWNPWAER